MTDLDLLLNVRQGATDVPLEVADDPTSPTLVALPVLDAAGRAALADLLAALQGSLDVALDTASLAALENIVVSGVVALDAPTLAALENLTVAVAGSVDLSTATLAALEAITATIAGTVDLSTATLAALESITATLTGAVDVSDRADRLLGVVTGPLTDTQLRATPVEVTGTVTASLGEIEVKNDSGNPVPVTAVGFDIRDLDITDSVTAFLNGAITKVSVMASAAGSTTIITPASGNKVRLFKFGYSADGGNGNGTVVSLNFGAAPAVDRQWLDPKQPYADGLTSRFIDGGVDEPLEVSLSAAVAVGVYVNVAYQEVAG